MVVAAPDLTALVDPVALHLAVREVPVVLRRAGLMAVPETTKIITTELIC